VKYEKYKKKPNVNRASAKSKENRKKKKTPNKQTNQKK